MFSDIRDAEVRGIVSAFYLNARCFKFTSGEFDSPQPPAFNPHGSLQANPKELAANPGDGWERCRRCHRAEDSGFHSREISAPSVAVFSAGRPAPALSMPGRLLPGRVFLYRNCDNEGWRGWGEWTIRDWLQRKETEHGGNNAAAACSPIRRWCRGRTPLWSFTPIR